VRSQIFSRSYAGIPLLDPMESARADMYRPRGRRVVVPDVDAPIVAAVVAHHPRFCQHHEDRLASRTDVGDTSLLRRSNRFAAVALFDLDTELVRVRHRRDERSADDRAELVERAWFIGVRHRNDDLVAPPRDRKRLEMARHAPGDQPGKARI